MMASTSIASSWGATTRSAGSRARADGFVVLGRLGSAVARRQARRRGCGAGGRGCACGGLMRGAAAGQQHRHSHRRQIMEIIMNHRKELSYRRKSKSQKRTSGSVAVYETRTSMNVMLNTLELTVLVKSMFYLGGKLADTASTWSVVM